MAIVRTASTRLSCVLALVALVSCAVAQTPTPVPAFEGAVSIASDPQFGDQRATLDQLVQKKGKRGPNELCVIGQDVGSDRQAWVVWRQDQSIILWEPPATGLTDLALSRRYLRLPRDVAADPQGSSFSVTPAWVADLRKACEDIGYRITIVKN